MKAKQLLQAVIVSAFFMGAGQAIATPVNVTASRQVLIGDMVEGNVFGAASPSSGLGTFTDNVSHSYSYPYSYSGATTIPANPPRVAFAEAHQNTNVNAAAGLFAGTGSVGVIYSAQQGDGLFARSSYDVYFELTTPHNYILSGTLKAAVDGGRSETLFQLFGAGPNPVISFDAANNNNYNISPVALASNGILPAGSYHLVVSSVFDNCVNSRTSTGENNPCGPVPQAYMSTGTTFTNFDFNLQLTEATAASIPTSIPTLSEWGTIILSSLLTLGALLTLRRKR